MAAQLSLFDERPARRRRKPSIGDARAPELKADGIALVTSNNPDWVAMAQARILEVLRRQESVTADDLRGLPAPPNVNCVGAAFNGLARRRVIRREGFRTAAAPSTHARMISVWRLLA